MIVGVAGLTAGARSITTANASYQRTNEVSPMNTIQLAPVVGDEVPGTRPGGNLAFLGPVRRVRANGITIGYRQFGDGPPVVLVVGQGSSMAMWGSELPRRLAARHQVTMYDLRGVGYSTDPADAPLTIAQMADDLASLVDTLALQRPTVVGWSTGGEIALTLATRHPGKAGALVLSGATAGGPPAVQPESAVDAAYRSGDLNQLLDLSFTSSGSSRRDVYVQQVLEVAGTNPDDELLFPSELTERRQNDAEHAFAADPSVHDALDHIDVPTLVTNGAQDRLVPRANAELIARRIPSAHLRIYDDTAHIMWFQDLDRFVQDVEQTASVA